MIKGSKKDFEKRYKRAGSLANDGELSKVFNTIVERGKVTLNV